MIYLLSAKLQEQITKALLDVSKSPAWSRQLAEFNLLGFAEIDSGLYNMETELVSSIGKLAMTATYY